MFNRTFFCYWPIFVLTIALTRNTHGILFPVSDDRFDVKNPVVANIETSLNDCIYRYYKYAKSSLASSIFGDRYYDQEYAHIAKIDSEDCYGVIISENFILTTAECASKVSSKDIKFNDNSTNLIKNTITEKKLALLGTENPISINNTVTPSCFWLKDKLEFPKLEHIEYDSAKKSYKTVNVESNLTNYGKFGLLQQKLLSNYRKTPFTLGFTENEEVIAIKDYKEWIEKMTNQSIDGRACTIKNINLRAYEDAVLALNGDKQNHDFMSVEMGKARISTTTLNHYKVQIGWQKDNQTLWKCGGNLIRENVVLTAASCLTKYTENPQLIMAGEDYQYYPETKYIIQNASVASVLVHPEYNTSTHENDIAIVKLKTKIKLSENTIPACLWPSNSELLTTEMQTSGLGDKELYSAYDTYLNSKTSNLPLYVISDILKNASCSPFEDNLCVGNDIFTLPGTCSSDFGSGLTRQTFRAYKYFDFLFGLHSQGENCGFGHPAVHTNVQKYTKWIESIIFNDDKISFIDNQVNIGDNCKTHDQKDGICILVENCENILQKIIKLNTHTEFCSFEKGPAVCCPEKNILQTSQNVVRSDFENEIDNCATLYGDFRAKYDRYSPEIRPYLGKLSYKNEECTAILISKEIAIASGSCPFSKSDDYSEMIIEFGLKEDDVKQKMKIDRIVRSSDNEFSFIIIWMTMPVNINKFVNPACVWMNTTHTPFLLYSVNGENDERPIFSIPRFNEECKSEIKDSNLLDDEVCITDSDDNENKDCKNQGELLLSDFVDENKNALTYLVAVYKRGDGCKDPLIYNRLSHFVNLIKAYTEIAHRI